MKIKLDQNLSIKLREVLAALDHDVDTVFDEDLSGVDDVTVLRAAGHKSESCLRWIPISSISNAILQERTVALLSFVHLVKALCLG